MSVGDTERRACVGDTERDERRGYACGVRAYGIRNGMSVWDTERDTAGDPGLGGGRPGACG